MPEEVSVWPSLRHARQGLRLGDGHGIRIAILDSGIETGHPDLKGLRLRHDVTLVPDRSGWKTVANRGRDLYGHGTAVAALIRRQAPAAELGSFRVLGPDLASRTALICAGARLALRHGYHILNCSFGCGRPDHVLYYKDWIDQAYLAGCHVVAASNNEDAQRREWPGHFPTVITAHYTLSADGQAFYYRPGSLVEFSASGVDLDVPWRDGTRKTVTGSSFAAAHLSGLLARLLSRNAGLHPLQAKAFLHRLARRPR